MLNIAVFASGSGSDFQSIIDAVESGYITKGRIDYLVAGKSDIYAIERAKKHNIEYGIFQKSDYNDMHSLCIAIKETLMSRGIDLIVLAGYLNIINVELVREYEKRIINIHPSLIPKHCGMGYYGIKVHQSVIASGDTISGATVHYVDEIADNGEIIMQQTVPVITGDTAESLAARVLELEHKLLPKAVKYMTEILDKKI